MLLLRQLSPGSHANKIVPRWRITDSYLRRKRLKLIKQGNSTHDQRSSQMFFTLLVAIYMCCSQIAMPRMYFDFVERGIAIFRFQQFFFYVFSQLKVQSNNANSS